MTKLILDLKKLMAQKRLSPETASHYIRVSFATVARWLKGISEPRLNSQRMILEGMEKIRKELPDFKTEVADKREPIKSDWHLHNTMQEIKRVWPKVREKVTSKERDRLLNLKNTDLKSQLAALRVLDRKYNTDDV